MNEKLEMLSEEEMASVNGGVSYELNMGTLMAGLTAAALGAIGISGAPVALAGLSVYIAFNTLGEGQGDLGMISDVTAP